MDDARAHKARGGLIGSFLRGDYIDRAACDVSFARMHKQDRIGDTIHLILACIALFGVGGPVSMTEIAVVPLVVFFFVRVKNTHKVWIHGFGQPAVLAALILAAWMGITLLWSTNKPLGAEMIAQLRWFALAGFVFPVIERRGLLIASLCAGYLVGHIVQIIDGFDGMGNAWLEQALRRDPTRISGWWDPAVAGTVLVGALGFHLPAAMNGHGKWRVLGVLGAAATGAGLVATGTRGGWIAALGLVVLAVVTQFIRRSKHSRTQAKGVRRASWVGLGVLGIMVIGSGALLWPQLTERIDQAHDEISRAWEGDTDSPTGARFVMARVAIEGALERPVTGIGAGSLRTKLEATQSKFDDASHAHNQTLHWLCELGLIGFAIGILLVLALLSGARAQSGIESRNQNPYRHGPIWALLAIVLVSAFDTPMLNTHSVALLGAIAALSPVYAPTRRKETGALVGAPAESEQD